MFAGVLILFSGIGSGIVIWRSEIRVEREIEAAQAANPSEPLSLLDSRKQVREVEIYYGKLGILLEKADEMFHGKTLAKILIIGSIVTTSVLFLLARRIQLPTK
jgi:hypothetical protein